MSQQDVEFADLIKRVQEGDMKAAEELHASYGAHIRRAVRKKLHERLRSQFDSLDFVQDVWVSFFADCPDKYEFTGPEDLIRFLTTLAKNKVAQASRTRMHRKKFNVVLELRLQLMPQGGADMPAVQRTPSELLMSREEWDNFLQTQPPVYRRIFLLMLEGKSCGIIADELGISERTISRVLGKLLPESSP